MSPILINKGTAILAPVSRVAGLFPPVTLSPLRPGYVLLISSSTCVGSSMSIGEPL